MRCQIFNCDKVHGNRCCTECERKSRCQNRCMNHPSKCRLVRPDTVKEIMAKAGIRIVKQSFMDRLLKSGFKSGSFRPTGLFMRQDKTGLYIGIDNSGGDAWTEEFESKEACVKWLAGLTEKEETT